MTKAQQESFNKALLKTVKGNHVKMILDAVAGRYVAMVSVKVILDNFNKFVKKINKEKKVKRSTKTK